MENIKVVIIGGGAAGLAVSHELIAAGVEHAVLEQGRVAQTWRDRWDSFCLVTPNWTVQLPGGNYNGSDPNGFMPRDEIVLFLQRYASSFKAPLREGVKVTSLEAGPDGGLLLRTSAGEIRTETVVASTGSFQRPHRPSGANTLPHRLLQIDLDGYRNASALPSGKVLVVGAGQSGCQFAEELYEAGRDVSLAGGKAPWVPRRLNGEDIISWLVRTPFFEVTPGALPSPQARLAANPQVTGHGGGRDLNYRTLQKMGVQLLGHFLGADGERARFASDLAETVAFGDARYADICKLISKTCADSGIAAPNMEPPAPFNAEASDTIDLTGFGTVIFTAGFRPNYASWMHFPDAFDSLGFPIQQDGESSVVPGLYFVGAHFLRKRKSSMLLGINEDAVVVSRRILERQARAV